MRSKCEVPIDNCEHYQLLAVLSQIQIPNKCQNF